jgi:hypothetical protein
MGRIGPWGATGVDPAPRVTGGQQGIEAPLAGLMGQHATATIVPQRDVKAGVRQVEAEGIRPIQAPADRSGGLAIGESFDGLASPSRSPSAKARLPQGAPRADEISKERIIIERTTLGAQVDVQIAFGKRGTHGGSRGVWNWGERWRVEGHVSPPDHGPSRGPTCETLTSENIRQCAASPGYPTESKDWPYTRDASVAQGLHPLVPNLDDMICSRQR